MRSLLVLVFGCLGLAFAGSVFLNEARQDHPSQNRLNLSAVASQWLVPATTVNNEENCASDEETDQTTESTDKSTVNDRGAADEEETSNQADQPEATSGAQTKRGSFSHHRPVNVDLSDLVIRPV